MLTQYANVLYQYDIMKMNKKIKTRSAAYIIPAGDAIIPPPPSCVLNTYVYLLIILLYSIHL